MASSTLPIRCQPYPCVNFTGLGAKLKALAAKRKLADLSVGPVLTWTTKRMLEHVEKVLAIPGMIITHVPA